MGQVHRFALLIIIYPANQYDEIGQCRPRLEFGQLLKGHGLDAISTAIIGRGRQQCALDMEKGNNECRMQATDPRYFDAIWQITSSAVG